MAWLVLSQAIVAASGNVPIDSAAQAKAMTPQALADALLAPGHPPVDHALVAPATMEPPPPPGAPPQFRVVLFTKPTPAADAGFCERSRIEATISHPGPAATATVANVRPLRRLSGRCVGGEQPFGDYHDAAAMAAIRDLDRVRSGRRPAIEVIFRDEMPAVTRPVRYDDGLSAVRAVPLDRVDWAGPASRGGSLPDKEQWRCEQPGCEAFGFYAGGVWRGVVIRQAGRITRVVLERGIPAPF